MVGDSGAHAGELERGAARIRYRASGEGPTLLLIHGWALDLEIWEPSIGALSAQQRVIRYDRRGFGRSTGEPSIDADVEDALALLDRLGAERAALLGASQGARVALRAAVAAPERIAALILDGPADERAAAPALSSGEVPVDEYRQLAQSGRMREVRVRWAAHPFTQLVGADAATRALLARCVARYPGSDLLRPPLPPARLDLAAVAAPTLVVNGELDLPSRLASGAALARELLRGEHTIIRGAGHLPQLDNPRGYAGAILGFLARTPTVNGRT